MKNILRTSCLFVLLALNVACENDDQTTVMSENAPELLTPASGSTYTLAIENAAEEAATLVWTNATYSTPTVATYTIEVAAAGTDFATIINGGTPTHHYYVWTVQELNDIAIDAGIPAFEAGDLDVRVKASLGDNASLPTYSNVITITVTPYEAVAPELFLVGAPQSAYGLGEWDNTTAMPMRYIGDGITMVFEAYVKVNSGQGFKFIGEQGTWDNGNYGTIDGAQDGFIHNDGGSGDIKVAEVDGAGLYYVQVDLDGLTYKAVKMNWGIIGDATPGGWDNETPMVYDFATNTFTITTALTAGEMKFRASNASQFIFGAGESWKFNVGNSDPKVAYDINAPNFAPPAGAATIGLSIGFDGIATVTGL